MKLAPELKFLCNKVASERMRPEQWKIAAGLRKDCQRAIASGQPVEAVQDWLKGLLDAAIAAQTKA